MYKMKQLWPDWSRGFSRLE